MPFGWQGDKISLVPLEKERHFENAVRWINDPEITWRTLSGDFPMTRTAEDEFFDRLAKPGPQPATVGFAIETRDTEEHIGLIGIDKIDYRHSHGEIGLLIGRSSLWNRGYGTDALTTMTRYTFDVIGLQILWAGVMDDNTASIAALQKAGYQEAGRLPKFYWKRGTRHDSILLYACRDDWKT
jgi:RimJ/RimL family protein N-acetyltransferase